MRKVLLIASPSLVAAFASAAPASAGTICLPVKASGIGQDQGNLVTTARITTHGILLGTTRAEFTITGAVGTTVSFVGPIVFTTYIGTLTAQITGTLDAVTGVFGADSTSVTGTGLLRGVTGNLRFDGVQDLATGAFTETITGRLCTRF